MHPPVDKGVVGRDMGLLVLEIKVEPCRPQNNHDRKQDEGGDPSPVMDSIPSFFFHCTMLVSRPMETMSSYTRILFDCNTERSVLHHGSKRGLIEREGRRSWVASQTEREDDQDKKSNERIFDIFLPQEIEGGQDHPCIRG
jgi:hypothetical protein